MTVAGPVGAASAAPKNKMLQRCWGWDYKAPCINMITITLADRRSEALGRLIVDSDGGGDPAKVAAHIEPTAAGRAVMAEWRRMGELTPAIRPLALQLMPDHLHGILRVTERLERPLGQILAGFKTGSSKAATGKPGLWSAGFQDTILFREGQLEHMFGYLRDNPRRLAVKRRYREYFTVKRDIAVVCGGEAGLTPGQQDRSGLTLHFQAIGNEALLGAPAIYQIQCSRSWLAYRREAKPGGGRKIVRDTAGRPLIERETPEFGEHAKQLLAMAAKGAVLVSPCISDGEREIARRAMEAGAKLVTLSNKGFDRLFKPSGRAFASASEGRLLMLAPAAWPYCPGEKPITRFDACTLNRIAQLLSGEGAAEIEYRGMQPGDLAGRVAEACRADADKLPIPAFSLDGKGGDLV